MQQSQQNLLQVTSYNILADQYIQYENFQCDKQYLEFSYRKERVISQIKDLQSDIYCLQEADWFEQNYRWEFSKLGYESVFNPKAGRYEGLATLYRADKFILKSSACFNLSAYFPSAINIVSQEYTNKSQILQICELIHKNTGQQIVICNTHLLCRPGSEEIMLFQLLASTRILSERYQNTDSIIFCGDFNAEPTTNVFHAMVYKSAPEWQRIEPKFQSTVKFNEAKLIFEVMKQFFSLEFYSSYYNYKNTWNHPEFTNYVSEYKGCLDYIFYNKNMTNLQFQEVKDLPLDQIKTLQTLPSKDYPSDHIPITSVFRFIHS